MTIDPTNASPADSEGSPGDETPAQEPSKHIDEGLGVFRALILMLIFYVAAASIIWFAWHAWRHWHGR